MLGREEALFGELTQLTKWGNYRCRQAERKCGRQLEQINYPLGDDFVAVNVQMRLGDQLMMIDECWIDEFGMFLEFLDLNAIEEE